MRAYQQGGPRLRHVYFWWPLSSLHSASQGWLSPRHLWVAEEAKRESKASSSIHPAERLGHMSRVCQRPPAEAHTRWNFCFTAPTLRCSVSPLLLFPAYRFMLSLKHPQIYCFSSRSEARGYQGTRVSK